MRTPGSVLRSWQGVGRERVGALLAVSALAVTAPVAATCGVANAASSSAAVSQSVPIAPANLLGSSSSSSASHSPLVTCGVSYEIFVPVNTGFNSWGWASGSSPNRFYFRDTSVGATKFCPAGAFASETFTQYGTSRCLYASGSGVIEGNCGNAQAKWDHLIIASGPNEGRAMMRSDYSPNDCIWYNGTNNPAKLAACNASNTGDMFL